MIIKYPDKDNLRKKGFALAGGSRVQSIRARKTWQHPLGTAGHIAPTLRKQGTMVAIAQLTFPLLLILGS